MNKEELKHRLLSTEYFVDNEYLNAYVNLVFDNRLEKHVKRYSQAHHVFPKCVSIKLNEQVDNSIENIFELKFSIHVLAHIYLSLCSIDDDIKRANIIAFKWMSGGKMSDILNDINDIKDINFSQIQETYENDLSLCGENHPMYGKKRPDLVKRNKEHPPCLSGERNGMYGKRGSLNPNYGRKMSDESRLKMSKSWDYSKHITDHYRERQRIANSIHVKNRTGRYSKEAKLKAQETRIKNGTNRLSDETKLKISKSKSTPVYCITTDTYYDSSLDAGNKTGLDRKLISKNCKHEIPFVKHHRKRKDLRDENYVYDDTEYIFCYTKDLEEEHKC